MALLSHSAHCNCLTEESRNLFRGQRCLTARDVNIFCWFIKVETVRGKVECKLSKTESENSISFDITLNW